MNNNQLINKALQYISREWNNEQITLEKVADAAGFSLAYFDRMFSSYVGQPVIEYVRSYKLICSAHMLRTSDKSIIDKSAKIALAEMQGSIISKFRGAFYSICRLNAIRMGCPVFFDEDGGGMEGRRLLMNIR